MVSDEQAAETDVEGRFDASGLGGRIGQFFDRVEPRQQAIRYAGALLARARRKNGWRIAEEIGDASPWRTQRLLHRARWNVDGVRDVVRDYVVEHIGDPDAVLALGEMATVKRGSASVGVSAQYSEATERVENCQVAVFAAYVSRYGSALVDRELFLPVDWVADAERCRRAGVPQNAGLGKGELGKEMVRRAIAGRVPFSWASGGVEFGRVPSLLTWLTESACGFVLGVPSSVVVNAHGAGLTAVGALGEPLLGSRGREVETDSGRLSLWAWAPVGLLDPRGQRDVRPAAGYEHVLVAERPHGDRRRVRYHLAHAPLGTPLARLVAVIGARRDTHRCLQDARERAGLDQYEVRTWKAWYRHVTLAMLAVAPGRVPEMSCDVPTPRQPVDDAV